jgi:hypothetical protein
LYKKNEGKMKQKQIDMHCWYLNIKGKDIKIKLLLSLNSSINTNQEMPLNRVEHSSSLTIYQLATYWTLDVNYVKLLLM